MFKALPFLILFSSIGVRVFPYQGSALSLLILLIAIISAGFFLTQRMILIFTMIVMFVAIQAYRGLPSSIVYYTSITTCSFICAIILTRRKNDFSLIWRRCVWFLSLHGLISCFAYQLMPNIFSHIEGVSGGRHVGFCGLVAGEWYGTTRATGIFWEPGVFQLVANISLICCLYDKKKIWYTLVPLTAIIQSQSTTGYINAVIIFSTWYCFEKHAKLGSIIRIAIVPIAVSILLLQSGYFDKVLVDKFSSDNSSGAIRKRDAQFGTILIAESPIIGHGILNPEKIESRGDFSAIANDLTGGVASNEGSLAGGFTSGMLAFLASYGIPFSLFSLYLFFRNNIFFLPRSGSIMISIIFLITSVSEPITNTVMFWTFVFSGVVSVTTTSPNKMT